MVAGNKVSHTVDELTVWLICFIKDNIVMDKQSVYLCIYNKTLKSSLTKLLKCDNINITAFVYDGLFPTYKFYHNERGRLT